jgi:hypothetical protein
MMMMMICFNFTLKGAGTPRLRGPETIPPSSPLIWAWPNHNEKTGSEINLHYGSDWQEERRESSENSAERKERGC